MSKFSYIVRKNDGSKDVGMMEASGQEEVVNALLKKGLIVTSIVEQKSAASFIPSKGDKSSLLFFKPKKGAVIFKHNGVQSSDLVVFARQLSMLLGAGVNLLKSLDVISKQIDSRKLYEAVLSISKMMEGGRTFKEALTKQKEIFSNLWFYLVETGEASGNLSVVLDHLAKYLEERESFKRKIISALMYPMILCLVAVCAVLFFVLKIVPVFTNILNSLNVELPLPTKIVVGISDFLIHRFFLLVSLIVGSVFLFKKLLKIGRFRVILENIQLKLPLAGNFIRFMMIESFATTMSILIESGVPIIYALDISERSQPYKAMQGLIAEVKVSVREGKSFVVPMEKSGFFPPMVTQMVAIGEEIGELSSMFKKIAKYYQEYLEVFIIRFASLFEPLMIVFMGIIIGGMVISIFLPIFSLATATGR